MQGHSNLLRVVYTVDPEAKPLNLGLSPFLKGPELFTRSLEFDKGNLALGEQYQAVRHSIVTGTDEFESYASHCSDCLDQFGLYSFFTHRPHPCSQRGKKPLLARICVFRVFLVLFLYISSLMNV